MFETDRFEHRGQAKPRLEAHVVERARQIDALGPAIARARIGEDPMTSCRREFLRKVAPKRDAAEPFMQHDDRRRLARRGPVSNRLEAFAVSQHLAANPIDPLKGGHCAKATPPRRASASGRHCARAVARRRDILALPSTFHFDIGWIKEETTLFVPRGGACSLFRLHIFVDCHGILMVHY